MLKVFITYIQTDPILTSKQCIFPFSVYRIDSCFAQWSIFTQAEYDLLHVFLLS